MKPIGKAIYFDEEGIQEKNYTTIIVLYEVHLILLSHL